MCKHLLFPYKYQFLLLCFFRKCKNNTIVSSRKTINGDVNVKCYYYNDNFPYYLRTISKDEFSSLSLLHASTEAHEKIIGEKTQIEGIEYEK